MSLTILLRNRPLDSTVSAGDDWTAFRTPMLVALATVPCIAAIRVTSSLVGEAAFDFDFRLACGAIVLSLAVLAHELWRALASRRKPAVAECTWHAKRPATWRARTMS